MKKKNFRLLLAAVLTSAMIASAMPAMAQTESVNQNGEDEIMLISAAPASSAAWTSSKLKAAKVDFTKVASASYDKLRLSWEPLSGVDVEGMETLMDMLDEIRKNYDLSILMTTHDFSLLPRYADQVVLIDHGVLIQGDPQTVLDSEEFHRTFHMRGGRA